MKIIKVPWLDKLKLIYGICSKNKDEFTKLDYLKKLEKIGSLKLEKELDIVKMLKTIRYLKEFSKHSDDGVKWK